MEWGDLAWNASPDDAFVFPVPGLYRVSAQLVTDDPTLDVGGQIQNAAGTVSWVYVTKEGGRVIHSFAGLYVDREASQAPTPVDTYVTSPESAIGIASVPLPCDPDVSICSPCDVDPYSCEPAPDPTPTPGTFTGTLLYENQRVRQTIGLANATMAIFDDRGGWYSLVFTDGNGKFTLQCPAESLRGHVQMVAAAGNDYTDVLDVNQTAAPQRDLSYYRPQADAAIDKCGTDTGTYMAGKPAQAELFDNITRTAIKSRAIFSGFSRGKIQVHWISGIGDSTASDYTPSTDVIHVHELRSVGELGLFEAAHEYGHALHQVALGGIIISGTGCQSHNLGAITDYQCAFVEGFAHYHAIAIWGTQIGTETYNRIDQGRYVGFPTGMGSGSLAGPQTEGAVASTLLHVGDGTDARSVTNPVLGTKSYNDGVSLGYNQVASAIRDCRITRNDGSSVKADGIDYLAYCLEKAVRMYVPPPSCSKYNCVQPPAFFIAVIDPVARDTFFGGLRSFPVATAWAWGAIPERAGYDANMRTVWACNLFFCQ